MSRFLASFGIVMTLAWAPGERATGGGESTAPEAAGLFAYDARLDLDVKAAVLEEPEGAIVYDLSYASPAGGRVTAFLVTPRESGRWPGVLFGHWGGGDRTEFLAEAILYARAGVVSLLPSYPWTRPVPWRTALKYSSDPTHDFGVYVQAVVDLRRGLDLLASRSDVDPERMAYVGHSYGAQWGAILAAVDRRPKAVVLAGGVPDLEALYLESDDPEFVELRTSDPGRVSKMLEVMAPLAAIRHVGRAAPVPLLFQFARYEQNFKEAAMRRYYDAAREPKEIRWYPTGHDLNDPQAIQDRADWLRARLRFGPVTLPGCGPAPPGSAGP